MKVLVTGGAGYLGANIVERLLQNTDIDGIVIYDNFARKNYNVLSLVNDCNRHKLTIRHSDILDSSSLSKFVDDSDVIIHLAAVSRTPFNDDNPHYFDQINHWGTACLASQIEKSASPKKVIFASSGSIYGRTDDEVDSSAIPHPVTSYAQSKLAAEEQISRLEESHQVSTLRLGNLFGIGKATRFDSVINKFFLDSILKRPLKVEGNGHQKRPFIALNEAVSLVHGFVTTNIEGTFNASSHNWSVNELVHGFKEAFPALEVIHINQNEKLRDLIMKPSNEVVELLEGSVLDGLQSYINTMISDFKTADANI